MFKNKLLKFQSRFYIFILGLLNIFTFSIIIGCSNKTDNKDNLVDSIARVKKINDSIAKERKIKDSIQEIKRIQDSIAHEDSIKKVKHIKNKFSPIKYPTEYGVCPTL